MEGDAFHQIIGLILSHKLNGIADSPRKLNGIALSLLLLLFSSWLCASLLSPWLHWWMASTKFLRDSRRVMLQHRQLQHYVDMVLEVSVIVRDDAWLSFLCPTRPQFQHVSSYHLTLRRSITRRPSELRSSQGGSADLRR